MSDSQSGAKVLCSGLSIFLILYFIQLCTLTQATPIDFCPPNYHESTKSCLLRTAYLSDTVWIYWSGFFCYNYTNTDRFIEKLPEFFYNFNCSNDIITLPIVPLTQTDFILYNITDPRALQVLKASFQEEYLFNSFLVCWGKAIECCDVSMDLENIQPSKDYCPAIWDGWSCFPRTKVDTIAKLQCSEQVYRAPDQVCSSESEKTCYLNSASQLAEWNQQTDYTNCPMAPIYEKRHEFHIIMLYISSAFAFPAIVIFLIFAKLRNDRRVIMHRNLLIAICVRNVLTIMLKKLVIIDALKPASETNYVMEYNGVPCRVLAYFESVSKNAIYSCMLVDGFYLHKLIVRTFSVEPNMMYLYGAAAFLTFLPSTIWAIVLGAKNTKNCWTVDSNGDQWLVDGFRIAIIIINSLFLLDILRIMLLKMNQGSTSRQTKYIYVSIIGHNSSQSLQSLLTAFRATLFLIPLFGIHIAITGQKIVIDDTCYSEDVYNYARYTLDGLQGIMVAVLFCYINTEVHNEIKNGYRKLSIYYNQKFGRRETMAPRKDTTATYIQGGRLSSGSIGNKNT